MDDDITQKWPWRKIIKGSDDKILEEDDENIGGKMMKRLEEDDEKMRKTMKRLEEDDENIGGRR